MSKKYGQLLTKHGKNLGKHGNQMKRLGEYLKDENILNEDKIDFMHKKTNLLLVKIKRDQEDYVSKTNKMDSQEVLTPMHEKMLKAYEVIIDTLKEIKNVNSKNPEDYIETFEEGSRRINWLLR